MFIGRKEELGQLCKAMKQQNKASLVYGKRRVGKTRLIKEALKLQDCKFIYYECIKATIRENIDALTKMLLDEKLLAFSASFASFRDLFKYLTNLNEKIVVVIDEYPYLSTFEKPETVDSVFQNIIDSLLGNLHLVISGSQISIMKGLMNEGNALYGRFGLVIRLRELSYIEAAEFYPEKSVYDKVAFYSTFGGSPFILQEINNEESLGQNIERTILNESSPVNLYASNLLLTDYSNAVNAERILAVLGNGKKRYSDIENKLFTNNNGNLAKQLKTLLDTELISQNVPINRINDAKKKYYKIDDNLLRFYYTYVYRNRSSLQILGSHTFFKEMIEPTLLSEYVPHRFEEMCRQYFGICAKKGLLPGITNIGTYYYDDPVRKKNGEFDVVLQFGTDYELYEVKYHKKKMSLKEVLEEIAQIGDIREIKVRKIGFISVNGFEKKEEGYAYFAGDDLFLGEDKKNIDIQ